MTARTAAAAEYNYTLDLSALPAFLQLQHLVLVADFVDGGWTKAAPDVPALGVIIPKLQQLTHLQLGGHYAEDAAAASAQQLPRLQELLLTECRCTAASFAAGPAALTRLDIHMYRPCPFFSRKDIHLTPSSTPGLAQLAALQWLDIKRAESFDLALLRSLPRLQHLSVGEGIKLLTAADGRAGSLAVISTLTALQHLALLPNYEDVPRPLSAADVAALTAPSQLTYLDISTGLVPQEMYTHMFPAGRQLPQLHELRATMGLLGDVDTIHRAVRCFGRLKVLDLGTAVEGEPGGVIFMEYDSWEYEIPWHTVEVLDNLRLTSLRLQLEQEEFCYAAWHGLARLTTLESLDLMDVQWQSFGGILELTRLEGLTQTFTRRRADMAPDGSPPDVWQQIAPQVLESAMFFTEYADANKDQERDALLSLCKAAARHALQLDERLQECEQQQQRQQEQLQEQEQRHQRQQQQLQDEMAELKATVAALQRQLRPQ